MLKSSCVKVQRICSSQRPQNYQRRKRQPNLGIECRNEMSHCNGFDKHRNGCTEDHQTSDRVTSPKIRHRDSGCSLSDLNEVIHPNGGNLVTSECSDLLSSDGDENVFRQNGDDGRLDGMDSLSPKSPPSIKPYAETYANGAASVEDDFRNGLLSKTASNGVLVPVNNALAPHARNESGKVGDVAREQEIERRMRELGLWDYKRQQEQRVADILEAKIEERDALTGALKRCRRRQIGEAATAIRDLKNHVQHEVIRDVWGNKVTYEVRVLMGCFTKDVSHCVSGNVVTIRGTASDDDATKLTKDINIELPSTVDVSRVTVSYSGGVVKVRAAYLSASRGPTKSVSAVDCKKESSPSISPIPFAGRRFYSQYSNC